MLYLSCLELVHHLLYLRPHTVWSHLNLNQECVKSIENTKQGMLSSHMMSNVSLRRSEQHETTMAHTSVTATFMH